MAEAWRNWGHVVLATGLTLPLAVATAVGLTVWRTRRGVPVAEARRRSISEIGLLVGTVPWLWMGLSPRPATRAVELTPLSDLVDQITADPYRAGVQIVANLLVFFSLGFFLPIRTVAGAGLARLFALGAAGSALLETLQYVLDLGRVSAVDDVLLNALGALLGGLASRRWWSTRLPGRPRIAPPRPASGQKGTGYRERSRTRGETDQ